VSLTLFLQAKKRAKEQFYHHAGDPSDMGIIMAFFDDELSKLSSIVDQYFASVRMIFW
jgi:hypothetical protein